MEDRLNKIRIQNTEYNIDGIISVSIDDIDSMHNSSDQGVYKVLYGNSSVGTLFISNIVPKIENGVPYIAQTYIGSYKLEYTQPNIGYRESFLNDATGLDNHLNIQTRHYITNTEQWSVWKYNTEDLLNIVNQYGESIANLQNASDEYEDDIEELLKKIDGYYNGNNLFVPGVVKSIDINENHLVPNEDGSISLTEVIKNGDTPYIDETTKEWIIGEENTGVVAEGVDGINGKSAYEIWKDEGYSGNITDFIAWMKDTSSMLGPKFAATTADCLMVNDTPTLYFVPNGTTFNVYLADSDGEGVNAHSLATGVPGDITNYAGIYDISQDKAVKGVPAPYGSLSDALGAITDASKKKGGMTIKYIDSDSRKYVQYRYIGTSIDDKDFENEENWMEEGVSNSYDDVLNIRITGGAPASGGETTNVTMELDTASYTDSDHPDDSSYNISDGHYYIGTDNNSDSLKRFKDVNAKTYRVDVSDGDTVIAALTPIEGDDTLKLDYYGESNGGALNSNSNGFRIDRTVSAITVELLFRIESLTTGVNIFGSSSTLFQATLATSSNEVVLRLSVYTSGSENRWYRPITEGGIYHVVFTASNDGANITKKVYVNSNLEKTSRDTKTIYTTLSDSLSGGTAITHFTRRIWQRELSAAEVSTLYNGGNPIEADISNLETGLVSNLQSSGLSATAWHDSAEDQDYPLGESVVLEPNNPFATGGGDTPELYQVICFSSKDDVYTLENGVQVNSDSSQVYNAIAPFDGYAYISTLNSVRYIKLTTKYTPPTPATKRSKRLDDIEENIESLREAVESEVEPQTNTGNVYDVSKDNNKSYSSLQSALADVPAGYQHGWVTIAYKDTYDVYKKVALIKDVWSTESSDWVDDIHDEFFLKELKYTNSYPTPVLDSSINNGFYYIAASGVLQTNTAASASACVTYRFPIQKGDIVYCTSNTGSTIRAVISFGDEQRTNFQVGYVPTANQWVNTKYSAESPIDGYAYITKGIGANNPIPDGTALAVMVIPHSSKLISSLSSVKREILYPYFDVVETQHEVHDCTFYDANTILSAGYDDVTWLTWRDINTKVSSKVKVNFSDDYTDYTTMNQLKSLDYKFGKLLIGSGRAKKSGENNYEAQGSYVLIFNGVNDWKNAAKPTYSEAPMITFNNCGTYKRIDFDISLGVKTYAFWAQRDDTIYLNTNFFRDIYLIRLGKGTHNLGSGTFVSAESGQYNGSYKVLKHWHQDEDWYQNEQQSGEPLAAHGGEYKNGHLYLAVNKTDSCVVLKCILGYDGTLKFDEIHLDEYIVGNNTRYRFRYIDGLCFSPDGKMYAQPLNVDDVNTNNKDYYLVAEVLV